MEQSAPVELEGRINEALSLPEVLQFLSTNRMTGALIVTYGAYSVELLLRAGKLVNSTSLERPRKLGQMLVNRGLITYSQLEETLSDQERRQPRPMLGQLLVESQLVSFDQLKQAIRLQLEEEIWDVLSVQEGSFKFEPRPDNKVGQVLIELETQPLVAEATRRLDEWARILKMIPTDQLVPTVVPLAETDRDMLHFSDNEWRVLSLINGYYNVAAVVNRSGIGRFETYRILNSFIAAGQVAIRNVLDTGEGAGSSAGRETSSHRKNKTPSGITSARIIAFLRKKGEPEDEKEEKPQLKFPSPISFLAELSNEFVAELVSDPEFYLNENDERLAELYWRNSVMSFPRADLVQARGNALEAAAFERYLATLGLESVFRSVYDDTFEALVRYLKMVYALGAQRIGTKNIHTQFQQLAGQFRKRSSISNAESFYFQDLLDRIVG